MSNDRTSLAIRQRAEATALAREVAGYIPPNKVTFVCITCGWDGTLMFSEDDIAAIEDGNPESYGGPCPGYERKDSKYIWVPGGFSRTAEEFARDFGSKMLQAFIEQSPTKAYPEDGSNMEPVPCQAMTLQPKNLFEGVMPRSINDMAHDHRRRELREQGEVIGEVVGEKIVGRFETAMTDLFVPSPLGEASSDAKG